MYAWLLADGKETRRAKGIPRGVAAKFTFDDYMEQLEVPAPTSVMTRRFQSYKHIIKTQETMKRGLCSFDDKRYILPDQTTLAYGHKNLYTRVIDIPNPEEEVNGLTNAEVLEFGMIIENMANLVDGEEDLYNLLTGDHTAPMPSCVTTTTAITNQDAVSVSAAASTAACNTSAAASVSAAAQ